MTSIYQILPLISSILVICLGMYVFVRYFSTKVEVELILSLFCFAISVWLFGTYKMFVSHTDLQAIFWDRFAYAGVVFLPVLMFHFALSYTSNTKYRYLLKYFYCATGIFLLLISTNYFVSGLYHYQWGVHTKARFFHHIFLAYMVAVTLPFFPIVWKYYKNLSNGNEKNQAKFVLLAFFILYSLGMCAFFPAYGISVPPFPFVSGGLFILILSYAILRHKLLDIRDAGIVFLTFTLLAAWFVEIFFSKSRLEAIIRILAFAVMAVVTYFLLRNIQRQALQVEQIERSARHLEKDKKQLIKLDRMKDEFLMMATHELTTPITAIRGKLSMAVLEDMAHLDKDQKTYFVPALEATNRLNHLSQELLNVTSIDQHELILSPDPTVLDDLIKEVIVNFQDEAKVKSDKIVYSPTTKSKPISLDQRKIKEVLSNLVDNAIHFTQNGKITIETTIDEQNKNITVSVSDTGIGIEDKDKKDLFGKFTQSNRFDLTSAQEQQGAGLGLYISKNFVELHGGKIWVESEKGKGSAFHFSLPLKYEEVKEPVGTPSTDLTLGSATS